MQAYACDTAALAAIGGSTQNTWFDVRFQIGRIIRGHSREETFLRVFGRSHNSLRDSSIEEELRVASGQTAELAHQLLSVFIAKHLRRALSNLRTVRARPNAIHLAPPAPVCDGL